MSNEKNNNQNQLNKKTNRNKNHYHNRKNNHSFNNHNENSSNDFKKQRNPSNNEPKGSLKSNYYGFPNIENEIKEEKTPKLNVNVDDHPRAMVLAFDKRAVDEIKPRKYTSGYEIFKINISLARYLTEDDYLNKLSNATGLVFTDKAFIKIEGDNLLKLKEYSDSRLKTLGNDKPISTFYKYLSYFANYAINNNTAVIFDL